MIKVRNSLGIIEISQSYFSHLIGHAVTACYGVAGMVKSGPKQGIRSLFYRRSFTDDGIIVRSDSDKLYVDLHITVIHGLNIAEISKSIINKVRYTVEEATGLQVKKVNVYVDGMKAE